MNTQIKLYNYEMQPPENVWDAIAEELDKGEKIIPIQKKYVGILYPMIAAAACVAVLLFTASLFNKSENTKDNYLSSDDHIMMVPIDDNADTKTKVDNKLVAQSIVKSKNSSIVTHNEYLTIAGPEGQAIKISLKAAAIFDSSGNNVTAKLDKEKKINKWRNILKRNNVALTAGNFLDIMELTQTLKDN